MKYVNYNEKTKEILGYYDDTIHTEIPEPNLELTEEQWQEAINSNATHVNLKKKELYRKEIEPSPEEVLENLKAQFISGIDDILNEEAKKRGYDDIKSVRSYAGFANDFQDECILIGQWSAKVWSWAYALQDKVTSGEVDISSLSIENVLKDMPKLEITNKE